MKKYIAFLIAFILTINCVLAQDHTDYTILPDNLFCPKNGKEVILIDKNNGTKFILDSSINFIKAINPSGKVLWKTEPYTYDSFYHNKPIIIQFSFENDQFTNGKTVIRVISSNEDLGFMNMGNGKYKFIARN